MNKKAQSIIEYIVLICISVAALASMIVYVRRSVQGKIRGQVNDLSGGAYYSPGATTADITITRHTEESNSSWTDHNSGNIGDLKKSLSTISITQTVNRSESNLSFANEPGR